MRLPRLLTVAVAALAAWPAAVGAMEVKEVTTPLGIKAWLVEDRSVPVITLSFSFAGGSASEPENRKGVTSLMATLLTDGAGPLDAQAFRRRQEDASVSLGFSHSQDRLSGGLRMLSANRREAFELLRLALGEPRFDASMLDRRRAQSIAGLNQGNQRPTALAEWTMMDSVFAGHPYASAVPRLRETLPAITVADLRRRRADVLRRNGLVVAAVGDIDQADLVRLIDHAFGGLPQGAGAPSLPDWTPPAKPRTTVIERAVPQSAVRIAVPGIGRRDPDWYAAFVMNHLLGGGGQQSRLFAEVREKRGLAYSVSSGLRTYLKGPLLVISTGSANERVAEALRVIRNEMARLRNDGVGEAELADAKTYLTGALPVSLDSSGSIAGLLHNLQVDGQPSDYLARRASLIGGVSGEDVRRIARRLLRDEAMTTVVVGKPVGVAGEP